MPTNTQVDLSQNSINALQNAFAQQVQKSISGSQSRTGGRPNQTNNSRYHKTYAEKSLKDLKEQQKGITDSIRNLADVVKQQKNTGNPTQRKKAEQLIREKQKELGVVSQNIKSIETGTDVNLRHIRTKTTETNLISKASRNLRDWSKSLLKTTPIMDSVKDVVSDYRESLKTGTDINYIQSALYGVNQKEFLQFNKQFRMLTNNLQNEGIDYTKTFREMRDDLYKFTGNSKAALELGQSITQTAKLVGLQSRDISNLQTDVLVKNFKILNSNMSVTSEEYIKMTETLLLDDDLRQEFLRQKKEERVEIVKGTMQLANFFIKMGYSADQAERLTKQMLKQVSDDPVERIKKAAKMSAFAGAVGMSRQEQNEIRKLSMMSRQELLKDDNAERLRSLQQRMGEITQIGRGQDLGTDIQYSTLMNRFGIQEDVLGQLPDIMQKGIEQNQSNFENEKKRNEYFVKTLSVTEKIHSAIENGAQQIVKQIVVGYGFEAAKGVLGWLRKGNMPIRNPSNRNVRNKVSSFFKSTKNVPLIGTAIGQGMIAKDVATGNNVGVAQGIGSITGGLLGGIIGSIITPGVGTVIGGTIGQSVGDVAGKWIYEAFEKSDSQQIKHLQQRYGIEDQILKRQLKQANDREQMLLEREKMTNDLKSATAKGDKKEAEYLQRKIENLNNEINNLKNVPSKEEILKNRDDISKEKLEYMLSKNKEFQHLLEESKKLQQYKNNPLYQDALRENEQSQNKITNEYQSKIQKEEQNIRDKSQRAYDLQLKQLKVGQTSGALYGKIQTRDILSEQIKFKGLTSNQLREYATSVYEEAKTEGLNKSELKSLNETLLTITEMQQKGERGETIDSSLIQSSKSIEYLSRLIEAVENGQNSTTKAIQDSSKTTENNTFFSGNGPIALLRPS